VGHEVLAPCVVRHSRRERLLKRLARILFLSILGFAIISTEIAVEIAISVVGGLFLCLIIALVLDIRKGKITWVW